MDSRRHSIAFFASFIIGAFAILGIARTGAAEEQSSAPRIVVVESDPPGACEKLKHVIGYSSGDPRSEVLAKQDALAQARELGATHVRHYYEYSGQRGPDAWVYAGIAFRCRAPVQPASAFIR